MYSVIEKLHAAKIPALFWGAPGTGKTKAIEAFATKHKLQLAVVQLRSPEDIAVPVLRGGDRVELVPLAVFAAAPDIVFIDEINTMPPTVQAAALRLLDSGQVGSHRLPETTWRVGAANPPDVAAGGFVLAPPVANRLVHVKWEIDPQKWVADFIDNWGGPALSPDELLARQRIGAFLARFPTRLLCVPKEKEKRGGPWPSPRTWEFAARLLAVGLDVAPAVGEEVAGEFEAYLTEDIPEPAKLMENPSLLERYKERGDIIFAAISAVVAIVKDEDEWQKAWHVLDAAPIDIAALAARNLLAKRPAGSRLPSCVSRYSNLFS